MFAGHSPDAQAQTYMTDAPQAPTLQGASCGTIGPPAAEAPASLPVVAATSVPATVAQAPSLSSGGCGGTIGPQGPDATFVTGIDAAREVPVLEKVSSQIEQFKGTLTAGVLSFINSVQNNSGKEKVNVPKGYVLSQPIAAPPKALPMF
jgi:hypothetical protein